jgi:hypothetical protein
MCGVAVENPGGFTMDNSILKKRLSTFRTPKGKLTRVADEVLVEVIKAWEKWPGSSSEMARELGLTMRQLVILVEKAKKLLRDGGHPMNDFREIRLEGGAGAPSGPCSGIELQLDGGRIIRFPGVDPLIDFLKKSAA